MTMWYLSCGCQVTSSWWYLIVMCDNGFGPSPEYSCVVGEVEDVCRRARERGCKTACIMVGTSQDSRKVLSLGMRISQRHPINIS